MILFARVARKDRRLPKSWTPFASFITGNYQWYETEYLHRLEPFFSRPWLHHPKGYFERSGLDITYRCVHLRNSVLTYASSISMPLFSLRIGCLECISTGSPTQRTELHSALGRSILLGQPRWYLSSSSIVTMTSSSADYVECLRSEMSKKPEEINI